MASDRTSSRHATWRVSARQRRRRRRWLWVVSPLLLVAAGVGYLAWNDGWGGVPGVGERAPAFVLDDSDGRPVNLGDYLGNKPVVLAFYMNYG